MFKVQKLSCSLQNDMLISKFSLHVLSSENDAMDQLLFRQNEIVRFYLKQAAQSVTARPSSSNIEGLQLQDDAEHLLEKLSKRMRCVIYHNRSRWGCKKYKKTLCIEKLILPTFVHKWPLCQFGHTPVIPEKCHLNYYFFLYMFVCIPNIK
ncbi:unnamed protein product [Chilo suppressalis]|uniref:Uncharacterized protein n=1 Tax=Chilo suppressalis TaxID=168631 RepID=A0ABN8BHE9_CHISP|nr:unnamed protein product [Chilo suppressalis]